MGCTLIIAEKPSVAGDIAKVVGAGDKGAHAYEGGDYVVSWAVGHLLEFVPPEGYDEAYKRWRLKDLPIAPDTFRLEPVRGTTKQLMALKKLLKRKDVTRVVNACDAGREGELIFREILRYAETDRPVDRLWLQSMTPKAIREALAHPRTSADVQGLADAADCRAESDWLIGMNATRALTVRLRSQRDRVVWSAGRVQTATLAILVRREREILDHEPAAYWLVKATFRTQGPGAHGYVGAWFDPAAEAPQDWIFDPATRDRVLALLSSGPAGAATETRKDRREASPPLFDLTSLQREANRRFGFSARRTLSTAQSLYEQHKLITYPRTDSRALPSDYRDHVAKTLRFLAGMDEFGPHARRLMEGGLTNEARNFDDAAVSDHFAIIPTGEGRPDALKGDARRLFELVARRFLAAFHPPAVQTDVERITVVEREQFRSRGRYLKVPGWRAVWGAEVDEEETPDLPPLSQGGGAGDAAVPVRTESAQAEDKETRPPSRLREASLLTLMETAGRAVDDDELAKILKDTGGLGTPATRAEIIETLLSREYAARCTGLDNKKALRATARGIRLIEALERIELPRLTSAELTAELEQSLKDVELSRLARPAYMADIRRWTCEIVERIRGFDFAELFADDPPLGPCPLTGLPVRESLRAFAPVLENGERSEFIIWKEIGGRSIDRKSAEQLVRDGVTPVKAGFFTRDDREYEASLYLDEAKKVRTRPRSEVEGLAAETTGDVEEVDVGSCPLCGGGVVRRTAAGYRCGPASPPEGGAAVAAPATAGDGPCGKLRLPLELCRRPLAPEEVAGLIGADRKTPLLEGFISKRDRPFRAYLLLSDVGRIRWEFPPRGTGGDGADGTAAGDEQARQFPVDDRPLGKCPKCDGQVVETPTAWVCNGGGCAVSLPREICKREIARDEASAYFRDKTTADLEGFVSKKGNSFSASLYLKRTGRHGFRFAER